MDEVLNLVRKRRSVRDFQKKEIPPEIIGKLTDALLWAPSAGNLQARRFYFLTDNDLKKEVARAALDQYFIAEAPLVVIGCTDATIGRHYGQRGVTLYSIQDVSCSIMSMMLVACENGLGSVWVGAFREGEVARLLNLPDNLRPVAIVPIGYPSRIPTPPGRVSKSEALVFR